MATILKITQTNGDSGEYKITPAIQYAFEQHAGMGFFKAITELQRQSDIYWIAWKCLVTAGKDVLAFGEKFVATLEDVEVIIEAPKG